MKPKKSKDLYQEIAETKDISKALVETAVEFYYRNVRTLLSELYHPRINVTGLGIFTAKKRSVNRAIPRCKKYLKNHDTSTYSAYYNKKMLEEKLEYLCSIKEQIETEKKRKEEFLKRKNGSKKNMEK
tara:strand:+ start:778 stop:1161 length:384 start_codon:yes stop_codon:yes gene_type:complete